MAAAFTAAVFLIIFFIVGWHKGFLKGLLKTMSLILAIVLSLLLVSPVSQFVQEYTGIGKSVKTSVSEYLQENLNGELVNGVSDLQDIVIDKLPITSSMKSSLSENNTAETYVSMGVNTFTEYIAAYFSNLIIRILVGIALIIIIFIVLRILLCLTGIFERLPIIGTLNRLLGALFGLAEGLLILWMLCLLIALFSTKSFGASALSVISDNLFLTFLYNHNGILYLFGTLPGLL